MEQPLPSAEPLGGASAVSPTTPPAMGGGAGSVPDPRLLAGMRSVKLLSRERRRERHEAVVGRGTAAIIRVLPITFSCFITVPVLSTPPHTDTVLVLGIQGGKSGRP